MKPIPCVLAALLALGAAAPAARSAKEYRVAGVVRDAEGKPRPADLLQDVRKGASFEIGYLDAEAARGAIRTALGRDLDFLPAKTDPQRRGYVVFVLKVANTSSENLLFNPGHARLATDGEDISFALDYTGLYEAARRLGDRAPTIDEMATIIFDRAAEVRPGGSVRKLIVFEAPREERFREMTVRLLEIGIGAESFDVVFPFRRFPVEEDGAREK